MLLKYGAIYLLVRLTPGAVAFASLVTYTRLLAPEDYGAYVLVIITVSLVQLIRIDGIHLGAERLPVRQGIPAGQAFRCDVMGCWRRGDL